MRLAVSLVAGVAAATLLSIGIGWMASLDSYRMERTVVRVCPSGHTVYKWRDRYWVGHEEVPGPGVC